MSKFKVISYLFVIIGLLVIAGAAYLVLSYTSETLRTVVDFVTTTDYTKLQQCGITPPSQFTKIKSDFATFFPFVPLGLVAVLAVISALMFLGGFYYHKGKLEDDAKVREQIERELVHKVVRRVESEKARPAPPSERAAPPETSEAPEEMQGDMPEEEEIPDEPPAPRTPRRKK